MTITIEKIDSIPSVPKPVEGTDYSVIEGAPALGDAVRITSPNGVIFEGSFTPKTDQPPQAISKTINAYDLYIALEDERLAIRAAAKLDAQLEDFRETLVIGASNNSVWDVSEGSKVDTALNVLVDSGLLTPERKAELIT